MAVGIRTDGQVVVQTLSNLKQHVEFKELNINKVETLRYLSDRRNNIEYVPLGELQKSQYYE